MKTSVSLLLLLLILTALASCNGCQNASKAGKATTVGAMADFQEASCNIGLFQASDSIHTVNIWIKNIGDAALIITESFTSCGCTVASILKTEINPGDSSMVKIRYNGHDKPLGRVSQGVVVFSNAVNSPTRIAIEGYMTGNDSKTDNDGSDITGFEKLSQPIVRKKHNQD